ncbi:hypothetical protein ACP70R_014439 [Stipagrostis hirtigluma subsp. patula]
MEGGGGGDTAEPRLDGGLPAPGPLCPEVTAATAADDDSPPSPPNPPPPLDQDGLAPEPDGWASLEEYAAYLAIEEEMLAQEKRQFEEQHRARLARLEEDERRLRRLQETNRQFSQQLDERERELWEDRAEFERQCREDWARLDQMAAEQRRKIAEIARLEHDLSVREEAQRKMLEEQQQKPSLVQPKRSKNKDGDNWDLSQIVSVLALVSGLMLLVHMWTMFPLNYLKHIVDAFSILWAFGSVVLSFIIFERFRGKKTFGHYVARLAFLCFTLCGLYVLYLIPRWVDSITSSASTSPASEPAVMPVGFGK